VTAWLTIEVLGADYRFKTRFYLDRDRVLYIRGGGDPLLISEELAQLASALVATIGKQPLSASCSTRATTPPRSVSREDTDEAYDALNSALAVNFNTIDAVRKGKTVYSAEEQTPITPLATSQFRAAGPPRSQSHQPDPARERRQAFPVSDSDRPDVGEGSEEHDNTSKCQARAAQGWRLFFKTGNPSGRVRGDEACWCQARHGRSRTRPWPGRRSGAEAA
jgi:hypothetical protein